MGKVRLPGTAGLRPLLATGVVILLVALVGGASMTGAQPPDTSISAVDTSESQVGAVDTPDDASRASDAIAAASARSDATTKSIPIDRPNNVAGAVLASSPYDWLQFGGNPQNTSDNTHETIIGPSNVATLKLHFQVSLGPAGNWADDAAAYLSGVTIPNLGVRDLLFLTTQDGHILALNAHDGSQVWSKQFPAGTCVSLRNHPCFTTASPVVDPNRLFVYTYGLDGAVHKLNVFDGSEVIGSGWPEVSTLKKTLEKGSSSLSIATANGTSYLYVEASGYIDKGDYQGHMTAINLTTGSQKVYNPMCSNLTVHFVIAPGTPDCLVGGVNQRASGTWGRGGPLYDPQTNRIFLTTGNGVFDPVHLLWGDTVSALNPDGTGTATGPLDSYTPTTQLAIKTHDLDLGSTNPVLLPIPPVSQYHDVAVQVGKDDIVRLINLSNLSGTGGPGATGGELATATVPQAKKPKFPPAVRAEPAVWANPADQSTWIFVADENGLTGFQVTVGTGGTTLGLRVGWNNPTTGCKTCKFPDGNGNSPLVANGVLYFASPFLIQALNPVTGSVLWQDTTNVADIHWSSPVVVNGVLYITDKLNRLTAFSINGL